MLATLKFLSQDEAAATTVEYGLLLSFVALAALGAVLHLGGGLHRIFEHVAEVFRRRGA
jgi:Flp pilus assembly pilin Flp